MLNKVLISLLISLGSITTLFTAQISIEAQNFFKEALEFNAAGDYASAISKYIDAYNADTDILGLPDEGLTNNAVQFFQDFLKSDPKDLDSLMWLGTIETLRGNSKAAMNHYQKVVHFAPNSTEAVEADREILRLEALLKTKEQTRQENIMAKEQKHSDLAVYRERGKKEAEAEFRAQLAQMKDQVQRMEKEVQQARSEVEKAKKEMEEWKQKYAELEKENGHNRRKYLYYKYKK